jgi:hypothetical protein
MPTSGAIGLPIPNEAPRRIREFIRYSQDEIVIPARRGRALPGGGGLEGARGGPATDVPGVMVVAAPLFGLLGTVLGMLLTFKAIGVGGSSVSDIVAKGISEALVATQTGLTVAIPGWMAAFLAKRWRAEYVAFLAPPGKHHPAVPAASVPRHDPGRGPATRASG